ncbi:hypothetical protein ILYODFUR_033463 [Ilyodon furcidens]|uniref:Uncharacterized protein n=1 Tax=Ilyodon furcidens TaxID=33524 RepID=A0ABV0VJV4_9TELE
MLSQGASSPADPNRHPRSPSSNKGQRALPHKQYSRPHDAVKGASPASRRAAQKGHSTRSKEVALPPETQNHQHPRQPSKSDRAKQQSQAKLRFPPRQSYSNTTHPSIHR